MKDKIHYCKDKRKNTKDLLYSPCGLLVEFKNSCGTIMRRPYSRDKKKTTCKTCLRSITLINLKEKKMKKKSSKKIYTTKIAENTYAHWSDKNKRKEKVIKDVDWNEIESLPIKTPYEVKKGKRNNLESVRRGVFANDVDYLNRMEKAIKTVDKMVKKKKALSKIQKAVNDIFK